MFINSYAIVNFHKSNLNVNLLLCLFLSASGTVRLGRNKRTGQIVAVKVMKLDKQPNRDLIVSEIAVMKRIQHENIVNYLASYLLRNENQLWVVMEYLDGGALTDVVTETVMAPDVIAAVVRECVKALVFLHDQNIIHRYSTLTSCFLAVFLSRSRY